MAKKRNRGNSQRRRGRRYEYKVRDIIRRAGYSADRIPLSGSGSVKGDIVADIQGQQVRFEVKHRQKMLPYLQNLIEDKWSYGYLILPLDGRPTIITNLNRYLKRPHIVHDWGYVRWRLAEALPVLTEGRYYDKPPAYLRKMLQQARREEAILLITTDTYSDIMLLADIPMLHGDRYRATIREWYYGLEELLTEGGTTSGNTQDAT